MGRKSKFIRDIKRKRKNPRDKKLYGYPFFDFQPFYNLQTKIRKGEVANGD